MSSNEERKIPKIVLKLGVSTPSKSDSSRFLPELDDEKSIFSTKISEWVKDYAKVSSLERGYIKLPSLLRKINQNSYKSIENVLELMGGMNDVEKKKTLHQVLSTIRGAYKKLFIILEFLKVLNEYYAVKITRQKLISSRLNLGHVNGALEQCSTILGMKNRSEPDFCSVKSMLLSNSICPDYFSNSIRMLSKSGPSDMSENSAEFWSMTLESQLRNELTKILYLHPKNELRVIDIIDGKVKILVKDLFEFEMTFVPSGPNSETAWFIISVHVEPLRNLFKNSLTGMFQSKYNYTIITDRDIFKKIVNDCSNYVDMFYYEMLCSQFAFFSKSQTKSVCDFQRDHDSKSFILKPWFMMDDSLTFYLDSNFGCQIKSSNTKEVTRISSKLSFSEDEYVEIFENLFSNYFVPKLRLFFDALRSKGLFQDYSLSDSFEVKLEINYDAGLFIKFYSLTKSLKLRLFNCAIDDIKLSPIFKKLSDSLIQLNIIAFSEALLSLKKQVIFHLLSESDDSLVPLICPEINSTIGFCFHLLERPNFAISLSLNATSNSFEFELWSIDIKFTNGIMDLRFKQIETSPGSHIQFPMKFKDLLELLRVRLEGLPNLSKSRIITEVVQRFNFEGKFINDDSYLLYTFGLPSCVKNIILCSHSETEISVKLNLENHDDFILGIFNNLTICQLRTVIFNNLRLLSVYDALRMLNDIEYTVQIESIDPLRIKYGDKIIFCLGTDGKILINLNGQRNSGLEEYFETDSFSVYDFLDMLHQQNNGRTVSIDIGLQDTAWLSGSFM